MFLVAGKRRRQDFDGNVTIEARIASAIDFAHAAGVNHP